MSCSLRRTSTSGKCSATKFAKTRLSVRIPTKSFVKYDAGTMSSIMVHTSQKQSSSSNKSSKWATTVPNPWQYPTSGYNQEIALSTRLSLGIPGESSFAKQPFPGSILTRSFSMCLAYEKYSLAVDSFTTFQYGRFAKLDFFSNAGLNRHHL